MSALDPNWISVAIAGAGVVGSFLSAYWGVKVALVRMEERQAQLKEKVIDHEDRIRDLERDVRPMDYAR